MRRSLTVVPLVLLVSVTALATSAQEPSSSGQYRLFTTSNISTLQSELNEAAALGFRVLGVWHAVKTVSRRPAEGRFEVVMQQAASPSDTFRYRVLAYDDISNLEKNLSDAAEEGYRYVPGTMTLGDGILLIMGREEGDPETYEYFLGVAEAEQELTLNDYDIKPENIETEALESETRRAADGGFTLVGLLTRTAEFDDGGWLGDPHATLEHVLLGERRAGAQPPVSVQSADAQAERYRVLGGLPGPEFQVELSAAASAGYHIVLIASRGTYAPPTLILEQNAQPSQACDYLLVGGMWGQELKYQLDYADGAGFRAVSRGVFSYPSTWAIAEKSSEAVDRQEYRVLMERSWKEFEDEFTNSLLEGWAPAGMSYKGDIAVLARAMDEPINPSSPRVAEASLAPDPERLIVETSRASTFEKEVLEAASSGYRVVPSFHYANSYYPLGVAMEKVDEAAGPYEYVVLSDRKQEKVQEELNEASGRGFRVVPGTTHLTAGGFGLSITVVMEKQPGDPQETTEHLVIRTNTSSFDQALGEAIQDGWRLVGIGLHTTTSVFTGEETLDSVVVLER